MSASNSSPLSAPEPWSDIADGYAEEMSPILEAYAKDAVNLLGGCKGSVVLDVKIPDMPTELGTEAYIGVGTRPG